MKKLSYSLIALAFAATAAQAQDTGAVPNGQNTSQPTTSAAAPPSQDVPPATPDTEAPDAQTPDTSTPPTSDASTPPDADSAAPAATPPQAEAQASPSEAVASADVTDAEVQSYAAATVKVQAIAKNAALDATAKQQQMVAAVTEAGIDPQRFNAISKAVSTDSELRTRIQTAMAAHAAAHEG